MEVQLKMGGRDRTVANSFFCRRSSYLGQAYDCRIFMETLRHFRSAAYICAPAHSLRSLNDGTER